jgi:ubiquinone/menaquinone biosynthesis C-methylase UbiE
MKMARLEKRFVNRPGHSLRVANRAVQRLRRLSLVPGWSYLDVGCGNGAAALHVADAFDVSVVGVDVDPEQIRLAQQRAEGRRDVVFLHADTTCLPFADGRFDIVATNKTTHHISPWRQAVAEMARVLRPGGYFVYSDLTVPAWLAMHLRPVLGGRAGVFTGDDLDRAFAALRLQRIHKTTSWHSYDAVFVK